MTTSPSHYCGLKGIYIPVPHSFSNRHQEPGNKRLGLKTVEVLQTQLHLHHLETFTTSQSVSHTLFLSLSHSLIS
jgi:hypothetical protein